LQPALLEQSLKHQLLLINVQLVLHTVAIALLLMRQLVRYAKQGISFIIVLATLLVLPALTNLLQHLFAQIATLHVSPATQLAATALPATHLRLTPFSTQTPALQNAQQAI
jgi:hypothetical protein